MYILGLSCFYHDAAACLIKNNKIIAAAEEERFTRKKHDTSFPINAIEYCLKEANITSKELNYIAFYEKPLLKLERLMSQHSEMFPKSYWSFYKAIPSWLTEKLRIQYLIRRKLKYKSEIFFIDHHKSHAASSYLVSPFKQAAIFTCDGVGEWNTTTLGYGKNNKIKIKKELHFPHSIGLLYSTVTTFLGFRANGGEGKVMGLAAYGNSNKYYKKFRKIIDIKEDGSYFLDMAYFVYHYKLKMFGDKFVQLFGQPRKHDEKLTKKHQDIAAALQKITEEVILKSLNYLYSITKSKNLCYAGGVALNSVINGKILQDTPFKRIFIQPAASDAGSAMGAALYAYNSILKNKKRFLLKNAYLGPSFSKKEIKTFLNKKNVNYTEFEDDKELLKKTAQLINKNKIIAWFQGRMEFGPRALGNRSILANPCNQKMKDILNLKVKHREPFRPFAPVITYENMKEYFEGNYEVPYMLHVFKIKRDKIKKIPAAAHVDGSGRLQTIKKHQNKRYYDLIKEFQKLSGVPILLNTSFNVRGEPIVCNPEDALNCMINTGIDYLVFENILVEKNKNLHLISK